MGTVAAFPLEARKLKRKREKWKARGKGVGEEWGRGWGMARRTGGGRGGKGKGQSLRGISRKPGGTLPSHFLSTPGCKCDV